MTRSKKTQDQLPCGRSLPVHQESEKELQEWIEKLNAHTERNGLKRSEVRHQLLQVVAAMPGHFGVPELVRAVAQQFPEIGAATIYRNIPVLVESGILQESLSLPDGQKLYEKTNDDHHDHIYCLDCHHIFEFHDEAIEASQSKVMAELKFKPNSHRHLIFAHCDLKRDPKGRSS